MLLLGNLVIGAGLLLMLCGVVGLWRFRTLYRRLLFGALLDTAGLLALLLGVALRVGSGAFRGKLLLIMAAVVLTAPLIAHKLGRSAYLSGHREEDCDG